MGKENGRYDLEDFRNGKTSKAVRETMNETPPIKDIPRRGNLTGMSMGSDRIKQALSWIQLQELPIEVIVGIDSSIWLTRVEEFREGEETLTTKEFDACLPLHRAMLSTLIAEGEQIVFCARQANLSKLPTGFTVDDLAATLETLHISFRGQHRNHHAGKIRCLG